MSGIVMIQIEQIGEVRKFRLARTMYGRGLWILRLPTGLMA